MVTMSTAYSQQQQLQMIHTTIVGIMATSNNIVNRMSDPATTHYKL